MFFQPKKPKKLKSAFSLNKINPVVRYFILSDILLIGALGLINPIFAVFVVENIKGATLEVVGISQMIYLLTSSVLQVPIANIIDKIKGERDDFWVMFIGTLLSSFVIFLYVFVSTPNQLYFVQFLYGITFALTVPTWFAIFSRHLDEKHEGMEWGMYKMLTDLGSAAAAALGGFIAFKFGFNYLFISVGLISIVGSLFLLGSYHKIRKT